MQQTIEKTFPVFEKMTFEHLAEIFLNYDENTCNRQSACYQTLQRFKIWRTEIFPNTIFVALMEM